VYLTMLDRFDQGGGTDSADIERAVSEQVGFAREELFES